MATVQRGLISLGAGTASSEITLGTAVAVSESYVIATIRYSYATGYATMTIVSLTTVSDGKYTKLKAERLNTSGSVNIEWQVVTGSEFNVQTGTASFDGTDTAATAAISEVTLSKTFLVHSNYINETLLGAPRHWARGRFTGTKEIELRLNTASSAGTARWYAVEWDKSSVQSGLITNSAATNTSTINQVTLAESFLLHSWYADSNRPDRACVRGRFSSTTQVEVGRASSLGNTYVSYFAVSHADIAVQSGLLTVAAAAASGTATLDPSITVGASFMPAALVGNCYSSGTTASATNNSSQTHKLFQDGGDSKATLERHDTSGDVYASWFVVEVEEVGGEPEPIALSGTSATQTAGTGLLNLILSLAGTSTTQTTGTGLLSLIKALSGASITVTDGEGKITPLRLIAGVSTTETDGAGVLTLTLSLTGESQNVTDGEGILQILRMLAGTSTTQTDGEGNLILTLNLGGTSTTITAGEGLLNLITALAGTSITETAGEGTLTVEIKVEVLLSGTSTTETTGEGALTAERTLAGISSTVTAGEGKLNITFALSGISTTETAGEGILTVVVEVEVLLSGVSSTESAGEGTLIAERGMAGTSSTVTAGEGLLNAIFALAGLSATETAGEGKITLALVLSGTSATVTDGTGNLTIAVLLTWTQFKLTELPVEFVLKETKPEFALTELPIEFSLKEVAKL